MALNRIEANVVVRRPVRAAFGYLSRLENMIEWAEVRSVRRAEPGRLRTGIVYFVEGRIGPKRINTRITFTDYQVNKQFAARSELGPFSFYDRYIFEAARGGTSISMTTSIRSRGLFRLLIPLVSLIMRRQLRGNLYRAAQFLENDAGGGG